MHDFNDFLFECDVMTKLQSALHGVENERSLAKRLTFANRGISKILSS